MNDAGYKPPAARAEAGEEERIVLATVQRLLNTVASRDMGEMSKYFCPGGMPSSRATTRFRIPSWPSLPRRFRPGRRA
jgi:hypothetical protein